MERKKNIDIAKGLLIILVIMHHLPQVGNRVCGLNSKYLETIDSYSFVICAFFMQAFFVITGLCSSFNKPFKEFVWTNFKKLIWAGLALGTLATFIFPTLYLSFLYTIDLKSIICTFTKYGTEFWFLSSLFICKMFLYLLVRMRINNVGLLAISLLGIVVGVLLNNTIVDDSYNYWYFHHSCFMLFFLVLGYVLKEKEELVNKLTNIFPLIYIVVISTMMVFNCFVPSVTHKINVISFYQIPMYIILATTGTFLVLWLSNHINSRFFEFIGKNSIIIYCTHYYFLLAIESTISKHFISPNTAISTIVFYIVVMSIVMLLSSITIYIVNTPYFKWILGK